MSEVHDSVIEDIFQAVDGDSSDDEAQVSKKSVKKSVKKSASSASEGSDDDSDESDKKAGCTQVLGGTGVCRSLETSVLYYNNHLSHSTVPNDIHRIFCVCTTCIAHKYTCHVVFLQHV